TRRQLQRLGEEPEHDLVAGRPVLVVDVGVEAVGVDHVPRDLPPDGGPDEPDAVGDDLRAGVLVREAVDAEVGGVGGARAREGRTADRAAVGGLAGGVGASAAARRAGVARLDREDEAEVVADALAGLLAVVHAADGARTADEAAGVAVAVLVRDDAVVEVAVALWAREAPQVHLHARALAVDGRDEVGVVDTTAVLGLGADVVVAEAAVAVVVDLEVPRRLVPAVAPEDVVDDVVPVEQVGDGGLAVGARGLVEVE